MQTYRPPVRMMANGGGLQLPLEQELSQRNIYSDIYQNLTGYFGDEKDKKIYELSDKYGMTPTEVLNAYSEGSKLTDEGQRRVPLGVSEDSIPEDTQMPRSSALNFLEQLVGTKAYNVGASAYDAVEDNVVDPAKEWLSDRYQNVSAEGRGIHHQDILGKVFTPQDGGSPPPTDPNNIDPNSAYGQLIQYQMMAADPPVSGDFLTPIGRSFVDSVSNYTLPTDQDRAVREADLTGAGAALMGGVPDVDTSAPGAAAQANGYLSDESAVARAVRDLEQSRARDALEAGADPTIEQGPFDRTLASAKKTLAGEGEETNIQDLADELDDYFKQSWYETSSLQQRDESPVQRIMVGNLDAERQERLARAIAAGGKFTTAESIDEFFKDDEGYKPLAPAAKAAAADNEEKDKDAGDDTGAAAKEVVDSTDAAVTGATATGVAPPDAPDAAVTGATVRPRVLPTRKPAGPELQQKAMDAVASGSVDSFLDKLSQKDLLAMAVGFLGATSVTAGTKAALANLLKSKEAADALALAKEELVIKRDKVGAETALLAYRYASLAQANGITASALAGVLNDSPLFGDVNAYMAMGYGKSIGPFQGPKHKAAQQVEATRVARMINKATGRSGSPRVPTGTAGGIDIGSDGQATLT